MDAAFIRLKQLELINQIMINMILIINFLKNLPNYPINGFTKLNLLLDNITIKSMAAISIRYEKNRKKLSRLEMDLYSKTIFIDPNVNQQTFKIESLEPTFSILAMLGKMFLLLSWFKIVIDILPLQLETIDAFYLTNPNIAYIALTAFASTDLIIIMLIQKVRNKFPKLIENISNNLLVLTFLLLNICIYIQINAKRNRVGFFKELLMVLGIKKPLLRSFENSIVKFDDDSAQFIYDNDLRKVSIDYINYVENFYLVYNNPLVNFNNLLFYRSYTFYPDDPSTPIDLNLPYVPIFSEVSQTARILHNYTLRSNLIPNTMTDTTFDNSKIDAFYANLVKVNRFLISNQELRLKKFYFLKFRDIFQLLSQKLTQSGCDANVAGLILEFYTIDKPDYNVSLSKENIKYSLLNKFNTKYLGQSKVDNDEQENLTLKSTRYI